VVVKTKNRFYDMRGTLDQLEFNVIKYEANRHDNRESKVYLSKRLTSDVLRSHTSTRTVVVADCGESATAESLRSTPSFSGNPPDDSTRA
jgi:hypothetical protein